MMSSLIISCITSFSSGMVPYSEKDSGKLTVLFLSHESKAFDLSSNSALPSIYGEKLKPVARSRPVRWDVGTR